MRIRHKMKSLPAALSIIALIAVFATAVSADENSFAYPLTIEGEYIQRIDLVDNANKDYQFKSVNEPLMLPAGKYRLRRVHLEGGFEAFHWNDSGLEWIEVGPDKEAVLKVGPPLTQSISITRRGPVIEMDYKLIGRGGENYSLTERKRAPQFAVYKEDKEITSGQFRYG